MSGVSAAATGEHIVHSTDGQCVFWGGAVGDLWKLGKPCGISGSWKNSAVKASQPSDPYLMSGYDHKSLKLSHDSATPVSFRVEVDITGTGKWVNYKDFSVAPGQPFEHHFPDAFAAYWVRVSTDYDCRATAIFR